MSTVATSSADLVSSLPSDFFAGVESIPVPDSTGAESSAAVVDESTQLESPGSLESTEQQQPPEPAQERTEPEVRDQPEGTAPQQRTEPQQQQEELPEGVARGKNAAGKPGVFVEESRWNGSIYPNHRLVREASDLIGEPLTMEALKIRNDALLANDRLFADVTSGEQQAQGSVLGYLFDEMARAREQGEVGVDPAVSFARTFYQTVREKSPDANAQLRHMAAADLLNEMFAEAAATGDNDLYLSTQHLARALANVPRGETDVAKIRAMAERAGLPFYTKAEMQTLGRGMDRESSILAENARLRAQLDGRSQNNQASQFDAWADQTAKTVMGAVLDEAIKPALASVQDSYKEFPQDFQKVVTGLQREVAKSIQSDAGFKERIDSLHRQAQRAVTAQRRAELAEQIKQAYVNTAKLRAEVLKKPILKEAAEFIKWRTDQVHARREGAQQQTAPRGSAGNVPRSLVPNSVGQDAGGVFDPKKAVQQLTALLR